MEHVIFKYKVGPRFHLDLPPNSKVLSVQTQGDDAQMWVLQAKESQTKVRRNFVARATGVPFDMNRPHEYVATFQFPDDALVFHLFEVFPTSAERTIAHLEAVGAKEIK